MKVGTVQWQHLDVTNPYCPELRNILQKVGTEQGLTIHNGGTYVCTEGPRFETPAEIKMFHMLGGDTVGMTNVPEVNLANEAGNGICYDLYDYQLCSRYF